MSGVGLLDPDRMRDDCLVHQVAERLSELALDVLGCPVIVGSGHDQAGNPKVVVVEELPDLLDGLLGVTPRNGKNCTLSPGPGPEVVF